MRVTSRLAAVLLVSAFPALAQETAGSAPEPAAAGTGDGASAIVESLVPYLGRIPFRNFAATVQPDPAGYRITLDPARLLGSAKVGASGFSMKPYSFVVSRREDGNWNYFSDDDLDVSLRSALNGVEQTIDYKIGPQWFKGVYSPAIAAFLSGVGAVDSLNMMVTEPQSDVRVTSRGVVYEMTGSAAGNDSANLSVNQTLEGFSEIITMKQGPNAPPGGTSIAIKAAKGESSFEMAAVRSRQIVDLYSFFVSNPEFFAPQLNMAKVAGRQTILKSRLRAALPLWNSLSGSYDISAIKIDSPFGTAKAEHFGARLSTDGIAEDGSLGYNFGFKGLSVSSSMIPAWAMSLIPREMDLRFKVDGVDLRTPVDVALADFDLARADPISAEAQARIESSFLSKPPRFVIGPSRIVAPDYDLAMSGSVVFQGDRPALTMDISAGGIDKAIATLQNAAQTVPDVNQAVGALAMAKGFGKTLADGRTQWIVDASSDGSVKVNGFQVKAPDPVPPPNDGGVADDTLPPDQAPTDDNALPEAPPQ